MDHSTAEQKIDKQATLRQLPSVGELLQHSDGQTLTAEFGHILATEALRTSLAEARAAILAETALVAPTSEALHAAARAWLDALLAPTLYPVINATGVVIHTNLGRAPLSTAAQAALAAVARGYSTLEYDIPSGKRGSRAVHAEWLIHRVTGAQAALVVNNTAAAVFMLLTAFAQGGEVIISRGQLVEIGGGFRIPDVLAQSGAKLVEVGTTNRTRLSDYAQAITENTAAIMVAHQSNYRIIGFTSEPELSEIADLAHAHDIPLFYDQGSGALLDTAAYGLLPEPTVTAGVAAGCDVIAFSGDKLLGGPQAGILCGNEGYIGQLKKHPLARALRADKLCLAALNATLEHYVRGEAETAVPVWRMLAQKEEALGQRAASWAAELQAAGIAAEVIPGASTVGGGSVPGTSLPTRLLALPHAPAESTARLLRLHPSAIIARIQDDTLVFDPRTVLPEQDKPLLAAITQILTHS